MLVGALGEAPSEAMHVRRRREQLGHHRHPLALERDAIGQDHHGRPDHAGVHQFSGNEARAVVPAMSQYPAVPDDQDVRRRAADVDERSHWHPRRHDCPARPPIRGRDLLPGCCGPVRSDEPLDARVEPQIDVGQPLPQRGDDARHAFPAVGKQIGHFPGHRHGMQRCRPQFGERLAQRRLEMLGG